MTGTGAPRRAWLSITVSKVPSGSTSSQKTIENECWPSNSTARLDVPQQTARSPMRETLKANLSRCPASPVTIRIELEEGIAALHLREDSENLIPSDAVISMVLDYFNPVFAVYRSGFPCK
jgi:hypothetical protein